MSRFLVHVATIAAIAAMALAAEMQSPGFWFLVLDVLAVMAERALDSLLVVLVGAGCLFFAFAVLYCLLNFATTPRRQIHRQIHRHYNPDGTSKDIS